jgi:ABC-type transporter Mla MlaB component
MFLKSEESRIIISCGEVLDISQVREFHAIAKQSLESNLPIEIDAFAVERADAAALQLAAAFIMAATASGKSICWNHPSESLVSAARLLQLDDLLCLDNHDHLKN